MTELTTRMKLSLEYSVELPLPRKVTFRLNIMIDYFCKEKQPPIISLHIRTMLRNYLWCTSSLLYETVNFCPNSPESPSLEFQTRKHPHPTPRNDEKVQIWHDQSSDHRAPHHHHHPLCRKWKWSETSDLSLLSFRPKIPAPPTPPHLQKWKVQTFGHDSKSGPESSPLTMKIVRGGGFELTKVGLLWSYLLVNSNLKSLTIFISGGRGLSEPTFHWPE